MYTSAPSVGAGAVAPAGAALLPGSGTPASPFDACSSSNDSMGDGETDADSSAASATAADVNAPHNVANVAGITLGNATTLTALTTPVTNSATQTTAGGLPIPNRSPPISAGGGARGGPRGEAPFSVFEPSRTLPRRASRRCRPKNSPRPKMSRIGRNAAEQDA